MHGVLPPSPNPLCFATSGPDAEGADGTESTAAATAPAATASGSALEAVEIEVGAGDPAVACSTGAAVSAPEDSTDTAAAAATGGAAGSLQGTAWAAAAAEAGAFGAPTESDGRPCGAASASASACSPAVWFARYLNVDGEASSSPGDRGPLRGSIAGVAGDATTAPTCGAGDSDAGGAGDAVEDAAEQVLSRPGEGVRGVGTGEWVVCGGNREVRTPCGCGAGVGDCGTAAGVA